MELWREILELDFKIQTTRAKCNYKMMKGEGLHPGQHMLLGLLDERGGCSQRELAKLLDCSPASVGVSVKRLERVGYVKKLPDKNDLRFSRIELTRQGREKALWSKKACEEIAQRRVAGFTEEEKKEFYRLQSKSLSNLENYRRELEEMAEKGE